MNDILKNNKLKKSQQVEQQRKPIVYYTTKKKLSILFLGPAVRIFFCSIVQYSQTIIRISIQYTLLLIVQYGNKNHNQG